MRRTDLCFKCHDEKKYKRLDPHNQIDAGGKVIAEKCLYCHMEKPDEKVATFKEIKLIGNAEALCHRCHMKQVKFHPINANHLLKPNKSILENIRKYKKIQHPIQNNKCQVAPILSAERTGGTHQDPVAENV